jgi:hypothetical protein
MYADNWYSHRRIDHRPLPCFALQQILDEAIGLRLYDLRLHTGQSERGLLTGDNNDNPFLRVDQTALIIDDVLQM